MDSEATNKKPSFFSRVLTLLLTFVMPGMLMLCIAGGIRNAGGYVWAYNTQLFFHDTRGFSKSEISRWMSWIPLVGGSLGAIVGGAISDVLVKGRSPYMRIWVLIFSQVCECIGVTNACMYSYHTLTHTHTHTHSSLLLPLQQELSTFLIRGASSVSSLQMSLVKCGWA